MSEPGADPSFGISLGDASRPCLVTRSGVSAPFKNTLRQASGLATSSLVCKRLCTPSACTPSPATLGTRRIRIRLVHCSASGLNQDAVPFVAVNELLFSSVDMTKYVMDVEAELGLQTSATDFGLKEPRKSVTASERIACCSRSAPRPASSAIQPRLRHTRQVQRSYIPFGDRSPSEAS